MRHCFVFAVLLIAAVVVGCKESTAVVKETSNSVKDTDQEQKTEDKKGDRLVDDASEAAK